MKSFGLLKLYKNLSVVGLSREIHSGNVFLARSFKNNYFQKHEPGLRHRQNALADPEISNEIDFDEDINEEVDIMNIDKAYDLNESEKKREKKRNNFKIIEKKFFSQRPQPLMLTCNERCCIRYLHKQDPVQWDLRTLSESFPATPDTIKKILKGNWKITPERAKLLDAKAQANWVLLAEGKLDADEHVLEHMKKFINRREVLLEQIKNEKFYLPEIKKEPVWNNGEFSNVLARYEKTLKELVDDAKGDSNQTLIEGDTKAEEKSSLELAHEKIKETVSKKRLEEKDSFLFAGLKNSYSKPTTFENLEYDVLKKADEGEELSVFDKAILENKLGYKPQNTDYKYSSERHKSGTNNRLGYKPSDMDFNYNSNNLTESDSEIKNNSAYKPRNMDTDYTTERLTEAESETRNRLGYKPRNVDVCYNSHSERTAEFDDNRIQEAAEKKPVHKLNKYLTRIKLQNYEKRMIEGEMDENLFPDDKTLVTDEDEVGKLLKNIKSGQVKLEQKEIKIEIEKDVVRKQKIDILNPDRIERENSFYEKEVEDIKDTSFWNSGHTSHEKAMLEEQKKPHCGPSIVHNHIQLQTSILSSEPYPERIKIPKSTWKKGLTYKVKDCYYDDDGTFLYRVPGMVK